MWLAEKVSVFVSFRQVQLRPAGHDAWTEAGMWVGVLGRQCNRLSARIVKDEPPPPATPFI